MPELPKPTRLSLSAAAKHIAKYSGISALHDNVSTSLHGALCDGSLIASGQYNGKISDVRVIPQEVWLQFSDSSFRHKALYSDIIRTDINDRFKDDPYYHNPTIATADIDSWITTSSIEDAEPIKKKRQEAKTNTGGAPQKFDRDAFAAEIIREADLNSLTNRRELKTKMLGWCADNWEEQPTEKWVREQISRLCPNLQES